MAQLDAYDIDPVFGCWLWHGKTGSNGRPIVWRGRQPSSAYRVLYESLVGPVANGLVLDHLCRRATSCVSPEHLEAITQHENLLRKSWAYRCRRKVCAKGHSMSDAMVTPEMGRLCRTCVYASRDASASNGVPV